eukprot:scpid77193/ scgid35497/ 
MFLVMRPCLLRTPISSLSMICTGLAHGSLFSVGFEGQRKTVVAPNLTSPHSQHISDYLQRCCEDGMTAGPLATPPVNPIQSAGLGIVPKKHGCLRVIHHLSAPEGSSVNDGIPAEKFSLKYIIHPRRQCSTCHHVGGPRRPIDKAQRLQRVPLDSSLP